MKVRDIPEAVMDMDFDIDAIIQVGLGVMVVFVCMLALAMLLARIARPKSKLQEWTDADLKDMKRKGK